MVLDKVYTSRNFPLLPSFPYSIVQLFHQQHCAEYTLYHLLKLLKNDSKHNVLCINVFVFLAVGAPRLTLRELDDELMLSSFVVADSKEAALSEAGDVVHSKVSPASMWY
jgi:hypothetical protein